MERTEILDLMGKLKLFGMRAAFDEIIANGKRNKISNNPFLHVGICVHVDRIKEFLREKNIAFTETD